MGLVTVPENDQAKVRTLAWADLMPIKATGLKVEMSTDPRWNDLFWFHGAEWGKADRRTSDRDPGDPQSVDHLPISPYHQEK